MEQWYNRRKTHIALVFIQDANIWYVICLFIVLMIIFLSRCPWFSNFHFCWFFDVYAIAFLRTGCYAPACNVIFVIFIVTHCMFGRIIPRNNTSSLKHWPSFALDVPFVKVCLICFRYGKRTAEQVRPLLQDPKMLKIFHKAFLPYCYEEPRCDVGYPYRLTCGACNNLRHPLLGKAFTVYRRIVPSNYEDGMHCPSEKSCPSEIPLPIGTTTITKKQQQRPNQYDNNNSNNKKPNNKNRLTNNLPTNKPYNQLTIL